MDNGDGTATLAGTPDAGTGGTYALTITAANGVLPDATQSFTLTVDQAPAITSADNTTFTTGTLGTFTVTTTGFPTAALSETGALPGGVTFVDNGDGTATLAGTPDAGTGGTYALTITAANGVLPDATQSFTLTVDQAPAITSANSTTFAIGISGTFTVTTTGFPTAGVTETGALPTGVTFVDNGNGTATLAGIPAAGTAGTYPLTITAANGVLPDATQNFTLTVAQAAVPSVTGLSPTTGPAAGGTLVTITGTGFTGATVVDFGTTAGTNLTVVSDTTITVDSPAGTGIVNVTVTTPAGTSAVSTASQFTYAAVAAPTVVSLVRFGFHMQPTSLVLSFSSALDSTSAQNVNNYQLMTSSGAVIPISSAVYDPTALTVTLFPSQLLNLESFYQLTVNGATPSGLTSSTGVPIDGAGNGTPGTNYVRMFSGGILAGPAPEMLRTAPRRFFAEARELAALEKRLAAVPNRRIALHKRLAAAEKRLAAAVRRLTAQAVREEAPAVKAVDQLLASGTLDFTGILPTPSDSVAIGSIPHAVRKRNGK